MPTGAANARPSDPAAGPASGRSILSLVLLVLVTFMAGYLGQAFWRIGARARPPSISAIATDASGGVGSREPVRIRVTIAVVNDGSEEIQVVGPAPTTPASPSSVWSQTSWPYRLDRSVR